MHDVSDCVYDIVPEQAAVWRTSYLTRSLLAAGRDRA
jgi:hypothetical protein